MRKLVAGTLLLSLLLILLAVGLYAYLRTSLPRLSGEVRLAGLTRPVEIWRDSLGVPHVWGESLHDVVFAQGYLHAQDRLWQMELLRRVAEGRLAEVLGEEWVGSDTFLRTLGAWRAAGATEERLEPELLRLLETYAAGVNAAISDRRGSPPVELVALRIRPEPWTVRHTLAVEKLMAWDLASYQTSVQLTRASRRLGVERAAILFFEQPAWGPTILPDPGAQWRTAARSRETRASLPAAPPAVPAQLAGLLRSVLVMQASNAWVVAGSRTRSGKPILANDMHLELRAPSVWYLMALHGGGLDVTGMTLPGAPLVVAGHSRAVAWGFSNAMADDADFFVLRPHPSDSAQYLTPRGFQPFQVLVDSIRVRGRAEAVRIRIRLSEMGPVISDVEPRAGDDPLALRWVAHEPSRTLRGLLQMNLAADAEEFVEALEFFDNPHQNVVFADAAGRTGYWMVGRVPVRGEGRAAPVLPVPGWTDDYQWTGWRPFRENPHLLDPPEGFVVTANNSQLAGAAGELITTEWLEPFRAQRIRELILEAGPLDASATHTHQLDRRDPMARRYRAAAVAAAQRARLPAAADLLAAWDLEAGAGSEAAALFYVWHERLRDALGRDLYRGVSGWFPADATNRVLELSRLPWVSDADAGRRRFEELAAAAVREAEEIARGRTWGELHQVSIKHPLAGVPALGAALRLNVGPSPNGGSPSTVNVAHYAGPDFPVTTSWGPSQRHVVDMADVDGSGGFVLPTGQSGLPMSRHYRDQFQLWHHGGLWRIPLDRERAAERAVHRLRLVPSE